MKIGSMRYLVREGFRNMWLNRLMSLASVFVLIACLILSGIAYMVSVNISQAFRWVYEQNVVVAYVDYDCADWEVRALQSKLETTDNVATVEYLSGEASLEKYKDRFSEELYQQMLADPAYLQDSFILSFADVEKFEETVKTVERMDNIDEVVYSGGITETLTRLRSVVLGAGIWMIVLLLIVSLFIIVNTIKLTVHNRRLEIHIMKSVGATDNFIRIPFVVEGMALGLMAGILAFLILWFAYGRLCAGFSDSALFGLVAFGNMAATLFWGCILAGVVTGSVGSVIAIHRYLHKEGMLF